MTEQRLVFGEDAELYDRARAGYADAVVEVVMDFAGLHDGAGHRALEVGAGTGKATVAFAGRGLEILALEPSPEMAAVARRNCSRFPRVTIEETGFEEWSAFPPDPPFELVFSAQAWHWVDPEIRWQRAAGSLAPGGVVALLWHRTAWNGEALRDELDAIYRRLAPTLYRTNPGFPGLTGRPGDSGLLDEILASGLFVEPVTATYEWPAHFTADGFVELLSSQSDHRMLGEEQRDTLFVAIRELIASHGGRITVPHDTWIVMARRR